MPINQRHRKHVDQQSISLPGELSFDDNRVHIECGCHDELGLAERTCCVRAVSRIQHSCGYNESPPIATSTPRKISHGKLGMSFYMRSCGPVRIFGRWGTRNADHGSTAEGMNFPILSNSLRHLRLGFESSMQFPELCTPRWRITVGDPSCSRSSEKAFTKF